LTLERLSSNLDGVEIVDSARKHGIADADIRHAVTYAMTYHSVDGYTMIVGPTSTGHIIEVAINRYDQVFHAMPARNRFLP